MCLQLMRLWRGRVMVGQLSPRDHGDGDGESGSFQDHEDGGSNLCCASRRPGVMLWCISPLGFRGEVQGLATMQRRRGSRAPWLLLPGAVRWRAVPWKALAAVACTPQA